MLYTTNKLHFFNVLYAFNMKSNCYFVVNLILTVKNIIINK